MPYSKPVLSTTVFALAAPVKIATEVDEALCKVVAEDV